MVARSALGLAQKHIMASEGCNALQQLDLKVVDPAQSAEDDMRLLRLYAENGDEGAFSKLVSRHMSSGCSRMIVCASTPPAAAARWPRSAAMCASRIAKWI